MTFEFKDHEDQKAFQRWAFGQAEHKYGLDSMHTWSSLHGDLYFLSVHQTIGDSLKIMYALYLEHGK